MASAARKVQERIFGKSSPNKSSEEQETFPTTQGALDTPPLSINIPNTQTTPTQPPRKNTESPRPDRDEPDASTPPVQPFRERLAQKLGNDYKGAEKYRLEQSDKREVHWKRWGPYLSDRQWVRIGCP